MLAAFAYSSMLSLQSEVSQLKSATVDRDGLIAQLDAGLHLAESRLNLNLPIESKYLTMLPDQNGEEATTKIFLNSTAVGYHYSPSLNFSTSLFNVSSSPTSSRGVIELTENRSIVLSRWGWLFDGGGLSDGRYEYGIWSGDPVLIVAVTIRNDYTSADLGGVVGNRTGNYFSSVNLAARLYGPNGSLIPTNEPEMPPGTTASSRAALGGTPFLLGVGQTKQVIFYLSPSSLTIDHIELYVSSLSA